MDSELLKKIVDDVDVLKKMLGNQVKKEWLSPDETAQYLGISINTLYKYVNEGKIPYKKIPGSNLLRFRKQSLDLWLETGKKLT